MNAMTELKLGVALTLVAGLVGCDWSSQPQRAEAGGLGTAEAQAEQRLAAGPAVSEPPVGKVAAGDGAAKASSSARPATNDGDLEPPVDVDAKLQIKRLVIAHGVRDREPVRPAKTFAIGEQDRIYAFVEVSNLDRANSEIFVSFLRKGTAERGRIRLRVGASSRWRTWAYTRLARDQGQWVAIVRNARGDELARTQFEIRGVSDQPPEEPDGAA